MYSTEVSCIEIHLVFYKTTHLLQFFTLENCSKLKKLTKAGDYIGFKHKTQLLSTHNIQIYFFHCFAFWVHSSNSKNFKIKVKKYLNLPHFIKKQEQPKICMERVCVRSTYRAVDFVVLEHPALI